jgi:polyhydroxybutyrate depolymerase
MKVIRHNIFEITCLPKRKKSYFRALSFLFMGVICFQLFSCSSSIAASSKKSEPLQPGESIHSLKVDGRERYYLVYIPQNYKQNKPMPLILNFHGGGGTPESQRNVSQMNVTANRFGFIVVYPQGTSKKRLFKFRKGYTWNAGTCCGWAQEHNIDDVAFTIAMLDDLSQRFNIDSKRIFATGYSNGALFCYRLACELSDRIAAIAPVAGPLGLPECRPGRPISVIHFHGTKDESAPYKGGHARRSMPGQNFMGVDSTIDFWLRFLKIDPTPKRTQTRGRATGKYFGPGKNGAEVALWKLEGAGHTWPGGKFGAIGKRVLGEMNTDISANEVMWEFFKRHSLR